MRSVFLSFLLILLSGSFLLGQVPLLKENKVAPGEKLIYKVSFGFLTVGEARIETAEELSIRHNRTCYHVDITGKTLGAVAWFARVNDRWGAYIDTVSLLPRVGYRNIRENSYRRDETTHFYPERGQLKYQRHNHKNAAPDPAKILNSPANVRDLIAAYQYLRRIDYEKMPEQDTISVYGFFEDEFYDFKVLFRGKDRIKTKFGKKWAYKLVPLMPDNDIFEGKNAITIWISTDANRVPLKIEANMFIGSGVVEIQDYQNLSYPL